MATVTYTPLNDPSTNLRKLILEQNASGAEFGVSSGWEPFEVLITKALFNAANTSGSLGEVSSVNGLTGVVVLTKSDIGLGNVPNTDATNASNLASGTVAVVRGGTGQSSYTNGQLLIGNTATSGLTKATLTAGSNITITNGNGSITIAATGGGGSGDVTAASNFGTDNVLIKSDGTSKAVQATGIEVDDSNNITGVQTLTAGSVVAPAISISATHGTDDTYHGITISGLNAGATIAQWEAVYLGGSSTWLLADANGSGTYPARGLAVAAYTSTDPAIVLREGTVRNDAWSWTPGGTIYLSATAGGLTQTAPATSGDIVQQVGFALTADIAYFNFASGEYATVT